MLLSIALLAQAQIEAKLTLERENGLYVFRIQGRADVPPGTVLRARVYAVDVVDDPHRGKREDEEPLIWEGEGAQPAFATLALAEGAFREDVAVFSRKPFSIRYRARIHYEPDRQAPEVVEKLGDQEFSRAADLPESEADYLEELRIRLQEAADELATLGKLARSFDAAYRAQRGAVDAPAWAAWRVHWEATLEAVEGRNRERYRLWTVPMERAAKFYVQEACDRLRRLESDARELLEGRPDAGEKARERLAQRYAELRERLEQAADGIGCDVPLDAETVRPVLLKYRRTVSPLLERIARGERPDPEALDRIRKEGIAALLDLPPLLRNRRRIYGHLSDLALRFSRLLFLVEAGASPRLQAALRDHDEAFAALGKLARLD